jgi:hypothetical protein
MRTADHSHLDDAAYLRTRAKEMRALAQEVGAFEDRNDILAMAEDYDLLAERIETSPVYLSSVRFAPKADK